MGRTACTEPQCLYKGALYLFFTLQTSTCGHNTVLLSYNGNRMKYEVFVFELLKSPTFSLVLVINAVQLVLILWAII